MNNPIRILTLTWDLPLDRRNIAAFRGALAAAAGLEEEIFHNHDNQRQNFHYRYPMVQYRSDRHSAGVVAMNEGVDAIMRWYDKSDGTIELNGTTHSLRLRKLDMDRCDLQMLEDGPETYSLHQWLPINQDRYRGFKEMSDAERDAELQRMLVAHILTFCRAVGWRLPRRFEPRITEIRQSYVSRFLGVGHQAFDLTFECDLKLPFGIGLGKGVSHGFGVVRPLRKSHTHIVFNKSNTTTFG